jgi:hypothetical protein
MHAWRVTGSTTGTCTSNTNRVDAASWTVKVYYGAQNIAPKMGVNITTPGQTLEVSRILRLADDIVAPTAGTLRWNSSNNDFEGYNGTQWLSLTSKSSSGNWGSQPITYENTSFYATTTTNDTYGFSVAISDNYAIAGAPGYEIAFENAGRAFIFSRDGNEWNYETYLSAGNPATNDNFGYSVSISGDYAIVGAPEKPWAIMYYREWPTSLKETAQFGQNRQDLLQQMALQ